MLKLTWLAGQACQKTIWNEFDPARQIWVVSDAKTKFFLNQSLLEKNEIISEPVKRAKEFWKELLNHADPEMRVLETLGSKIQARDFLIRKGTSDWCKRPNAPKKLLEACESMGPLLVNRQAKEVLDSFELEFKENSGPFLELARLGIEFYEECVKEKRLPRFWCPYFLYELDRPLISDRQIIFDLGFDMRDGERELIQHLSRTNDITVLIPAANAEQVQDSGLFAYRNFEIGVNNVKNLQVANGVEEAPLSLWRCSSPEAEARKAVETVAELVSQGVSPGNICIAAPHISDYENILNHDLEWEGVGFQRTIKACVSASRLFRALGGRLQIMAGALNAALLEESFLSVAVYKEAARRREERRTLKPIIHLEQIPDDNLQKQIVDLRRKFKKGPLSILDFEKILIDIFGDLVQLASAYENKADSDERNGVFLRVIQNLRSEVGEAKLEISLWIEAWQEITTSMSLIQQEATEGGVWGVDLASCEEVPSAYLIILGALESKSRSSVVAGLGPEKLSFLGSLGFDLSASRERKTDPFLKWVISGERKKIILSCAKTDSTGRAAAAGSVWIKLAAEKKKDLEKLDFALHTKWIDVQKTILNQDTASRVDVFKGWPQGVAEKVGFLVNEEIKGARKIKLPLQPASPLPIRMSASRIEAYWDCPYKFFARSYLGLFDEADLEIEPSPQARGQWLHSAVEKILSDQAVPLEQWDSKKLSDLVDSLDQVQKQISSDIWPSIRSRFVRQLSRFIESEIIWRKEYPRAKPQEFEAEISGLISWSEEPSGVHRGIHFAKTNAEDEFWADFKGSIDRIDVTEKRAIILDYKSSGSAASNIPSWAKRGSFQLALYSEAVEAGLLNHETYKVIAAQYYSLKKLDRQKGFRLIDEDLAGILPLEGSPKADVDRQTRDGYFQEIEESVHDVLEKIRQGEMTPKPQSEKNCPSCSWRTSCRAPHLS